MIPIIKVCNFDENTVVITDYTLDSNEYIPEDFSSSDYLNNKFKYSETCTVNIIEKITTDKSEFIDTLYTPHCSYLDEAYYSFTNDGYYIIHHLILPTTDWLYKLKSLDSSIAIYVTDGESISLYKNGELKTIEDIGTIALINTENTTISRLDIDQFAINNLYNCYINLCKLIFNNINYKCNSVDNSLTFNRDFIWMTINVLKFYVEFNLLMEAQRLLEEINYCGGICNEAKVLNKKGCGCNKS